jgi:hypothetical protein
LTIDPPAVKLEGRKEGAKKKVPTDLKRTAKNKRSRSKKSLDEPPEGEYNRGAGWRRRGDAEKKS